MEFLFLLVPIALTLLALCFFKKELNVLECIIPTVVVLIVILIMKYFMYSSIVSDTEYYSAYITEVKHVDKWDEWITKTCSTTNCDSKGKNCKTTYYDCSYKETHPEYWGATLNTGSIISISEDYYNSIVSEWGNSTFIDMHRDYYRIDGDAQKSDWDGKFSSVKVVDSEGTYINKTQASETVFYFGDLSKEEQKQVFDYPEVSGGYQQSCLGCSDYEISTLRKINGLLGRQYQIKIFVLVFDGKTVSISELQKRFWKGGNKNELVICVDSKNKWAKSFSWQDNKLLETKTNKLFIQKNLTLTQKITETKKNVQKYWKRKEFKDFNYIEVSLTTSQLMWIFAVSVIVTTFCLWFGINNDV